jgi:PAS domain-containing protein
MAALLEGGEPPIAAGETLMTDHGHIPAPRSAPSSARLEEAINHLSLGIVIFDEKREVVFCNERYREMYGL